jgi:cytosine/adenosine deaminase-related metal-dependent hydrolase
MLIVASHQVYQNHGIVLEHGKISSILSNEDIDKLMLEEDIEIIDAGDKVVMPGFVNAHMHQYGMLAHGIPVNVEITGFKGFLENFWWPYVENRLTHEDIQVTTKASCIEMIKSGITGYCDTLEAPFSLPGVLIKQADEVEKVGLRAILSFESSERISIENGLAAIKENADFIKWGQESKGLVQGMMCVHTSFTCTPQFLAKAKAEAEKLGGRWQFHLSESSYEPEYCLKKMGKRPVHHYCDLGLLDEKTLVSQCVQVNQEEVNILKAHEVSVVHMPLSNCEVGGGVAPMPQMLAKGLVVGLGTDGYINDFFTVMKGAFLIHKAYQQNPSVMPAREVFRMATELGAKALGWDNVGTLAIGNEADLIILENKFPTPLTKENIFDQLVVFGQKEYVDSVFVAGQPIMFNKKLQTLDEDTVMAELRDQATKFWEGG